MAAYNLPLAVSQIPSPDILSGWKDIAHYLGKGVRTVQRYECELGLPVHHPAARKAKGSVIATKAELDAWVMASPSREAFPLRHLALDNAKLLCEFGQRMKEFCQLSQEVTERQEKLHQTVEMLKVSVRWSAR